MLTNVMQRVRRQNDDDGEAPTMQDGLQEQRRPVIGIALGGGAARGWAHIGVVRALEDAGIYPDVVAGTSIGAVVGGCSVANHLNELERFALSLTRRRLLTLLDFNLRGSSLITGSRLTALLDRYLGHMRLEDLPRRFVSVATELGTGHEIWFQRGELVRALRASYALPGIFKPVRVDGRWLVDGALVNPVPVSVCRAHGARVVIAVTASGDMFGRGTVVHDGIAQNGSNGVEEEDDATAGFHAEAKGLLKRQLSGELEGPPGISSVMMEAFNIIQDRISRSRLAGDPPDVTISPRVGEIGLFDFHRAEEAISAGYEATQKSIEQINTYATALS